MKKDPILQLEELHSMPINRCDPYNFVYVSPYSNTIAVGMSNGVIFMTLRQQKPPTALDAEKVQSTESPNTSVSSSDESLAAVQNGDSSIFRTSLQIISAVDIDFQIEDPISRYRPSFVTGLVEDDAEYFYYDNILCQKPASRQQAASLSRSLCRASGAHIVKIFSALVSLDNREINEVEGSDEQVKTGCEVIFAITSTGGWYAFSNDSWVHPQRPIWSKLDSWNSVLPILHRSVPEYSRSPLEASSGYMKSLQTLCCVDLITAESRNGSVLIYLVNGRGQLLAHQVSVNISNRSPVSRGATPVSSVSSTPEYPADKPKGKLFTPPFDGKCEKLCYIPTTRSLVCGCANGFIYLLQNIRPVLPLEGSTPLEIEFDSSKLIWSHADLCVSLFSILTQPSTAIAKFANTEVLVAAKGSYLTVWILPDMLMMASCHIDVFPIISVSSSTFETSTSGELACFMVVTQKSVFTASLTKDKSGACSLSCKRVLAVDEVSSPLGSSGNNDGNTSVNVASAMNDSFKRRHLSSGHWLFLGFGFSPSLKFFVAATGIFCPCKSSLLLAPSFSIKAFVRKPVAPLSVNATTGWDDCAYDLTYSIKSEADLRKLLDTINGSSDIQHLMKTYLILSRACNAYVNGCPLLSAPADLLKAKTSLKRRLFKTHLAKFAQSLPLRSESQGNIAQFSSYLNHLRSICLSLEVDSPELQALSKRTKVKDQLLCPACKRDISPKDPTYDLLAWECINHHIFRSCSKSIMPYWIAKPPQSGLENFDLPMYCHNCSEVTLRGRCDSDDASDIERAIVTSLRLPCIFCGCRVI